VDASTVSSGFDMIVATRKKKVNNKNENDDDVDDDDDDDDKGNVKCTATTYKSNKYLAAAASAKQNAS